jgi:two-component system, NarL family, response regulator DegU
VTPAGVRGKAIRVLLADSNQTQSQLLSSALRRRPGMKVTCCRSDLVDCMNALGSAQVDIVLLSDGATDHKHLIATLRAVHTSHPQIGLILLLDNYDRSLVVSAMREGTRGLFCRAREPFQALCRCISVVYQGQFWANTEQVGYVIEALNSMPHVRVIDANGEGVLTSREEQLVALVAEGISNREVAQQLYLKENTVKKALLRIYDKLGVSNRVEVVLYAITHRSVGRHASPTATTPTAEGVALNHVDRDRDTLRAPNRSLSSKRSESSNRN